MYCKRKRKSSLDLILTDPSDQSIHVLWELLCKNSTEEVACVCAWVWGSSLLPQVWDSAAHGLLSHGLPSPGHADEGYWKALQQRLCLQEESLGLEEDAVKAPHGHPIFACLSCQCQPILWAACARLKVFGFDNLISASPFLACMSTCWLPCVTLLVLHPSVKNLLTKCIKIRQYDLMYIGMLFPTVQKSE